MDEAKREIVAAWLAKARSDLRAAVRLSGGPDPILDAAIYHCQQVAEKAIKGFLVLHDRRFDKTHDIAALISQAKTIEPGFGPLLEGADRLSSYAVEFRYPASRAAPSPEEFRAALDHARRIVEFVASRLPGEALPLDF